MDYFPIFLRLNDKRVLVVGGGETALRKIRLLQKTPCRITVVAPEIHADIESLAKLTEGSLTLVQAGYEANHLSKHYLVIAATNDEQINQQVAAHAEQRGLLVNVVDRTAQCRFIFPSIVDRDPVVIALSSGGTAPVLLRQWRTRLEGLVPQHLGQLAKFCQRFRATVKSTFDSVDKRRRFWEKFLEDPVTEDVYQGRTETAERRLHQLLAEPESNLGKVALVGAGPGDPDLLTFKALRLMQNADVVLYDRLVSGAVMELVRRDADLINVGKKAKHHTMPQEDINALMIRLAQEGKRVVRLKGGDPFVFGRGGEEVMSLIEQGIPVEVVPGITSAAAASSYCGIPLTHRDHAQSVLFTTGHLKSGQLDLAWSQLARSGQTLVIYMGLGNLARICDGLQEHGLSAETPVAVAAAVSRAEQSIRIGTIANIASLLAANPIESPALIVVGDVVGLHEKFRPLVRNTSEKIEN